MKNPDRARKFRDLAESMQSKIDRLRGPRLENTPKRAREGMSARLEAANMERVQNALRVLATAHDAGTVPPALESLSNRSQIEPMVSKQTESHGYYHVCESKNYRDDSNTAKALREFVELNKGAEAREREEAGRKAAALAELERGVKFSPIPGFFPTPAEVVAQMLEAAGCVAGMHVLEPSAGKGDILEAVGRLGCKAQGLELNSTLAGICKAKGLDCDSADFMECKPSPVYDRAIMNPPFEKGQDAKHVQRAFEWIKPGGRVVALVSAGTMQTERMQWFRDWLDSVGYVSEELPEGSFTGAGAFRETGVRIVMLTIDKPGPEFVPTAAPLHAPIVEPVEPEEVENAPLFVPASRINNPASRPARCGPVPTVHAPSKGRPPEVPATLSPAAQSILAALGKVGGKGDKRTLIGAGADKAAWSDALSECYRAKVVQRVKGAEVVHALA